MPLFLCAFVPLCLPPLCPSCPRPESRETSVKPIPDPGKSNRNPVCLSSFVPLCAFVPSPLVPSCPRPGIQGNRTGIRVCLSSPLVSFVPLCLPPSCVLPQTRNPGGVCLTGLDPRLREDDKYTRDTHILEKSCRTQVIYSILPCTNQELKFNL